MVAKLSLKRSFSVRIISASGAQSRARLQQGKHCPLGSQATITPWSSSASSIRRSRTLLSKRRPTTGPNARQSSEASCRQKTRRESGRVLEPFASPRTADRQRPNLSQREASARQLSDGICAAPVSINPAIDFAFAVSLRSSTATGCHLWAASPTPRT